MSGGQQDNTEKSWWRWFLNGFSSLFLLIMGLVFAPILTVLALIAMVAKNRRNLSGKAFNAFLADHLYLAIGMLILEVGVLHWLFPVTNIIANSLLGFLGGPVVWILFGACLGVLIFASVTNQLMGRSEDQRVRQKSTEKPGIIERYGLPLVTFIFSPIATVLGFLVAYKKDTSLSALIKKYPLIAFGFAALEVGLLHWLVPQTNFILNLTLGAVSAVVTSPILWCLVGLALILIAYSVYRGWRNSSPSPSKSFLSRLEVRSDLPQPSQRFSLPAAPVSATTTNTVNNNGSVWGPVGEVRPDRNSFPGADAI